MTFIRISKTVHFDMAHALQAYPGKCRNIHGHCYALTVTVLGKPCTEKGSQNEGMVVDFSFLKKALHEKVVSHYDHSLVLQENYGQSINKALQESKNAVAGLKPVPFQPTAENLLIDMVHRLKDYLPENVKLIKAKLSESENSYAEWLLSDQNLDE